jgi:hypothetical protein
MPGKKAQNSQVFGLKIRWQAYSLFAFCSKHLQIACASELSLRGDSGSEAFFVAHESL